jgi:glutathione S-transferase
MVPLLEHGQELVIESTVVARYIARHVGGPELYPRTVEDVERIERFLSIWADVETTYYDLLRASSDTQAEERRALFVDRLAAVDKLLGARAPFLLGEDFSFAECIAGPWVQRFFVTLPYFRGIDFDDVLRAFDALPGWARAVRDRASCQESICPEGEMIDAAKRYYVSYLSPGATGVV